MRIAPVRARPFYWQHGVVGLGLSREFDALVLMGNPYYLSTWIAAALARLRGRPVLFWTHGWLRRERGLAGLVRRAFYRLADRLLLYGERGKRLGIAAGYPAERMTVIYNSLDADRAEAVLADIVAGRSPYPPPGALFADPARPLVVCTARLTALCRFDLLLRAAALLAGRGRPVNVLLVGDGPERAALEALARDLAVDVHFAGAVYDEERLGAWLYHADLTVSPGKVGLTAIHSLMYGTPVITHGNLDRQMPEAEAVVAGETGAFFREGDADALADAIADWLAGPRDRAKVRSACRAAIRETWNPDNQARRLIEAVEREVRR